MNDSDRPDPHPDMRGCFAYLPAPPHHPGDGFFCPLCGRVYKREAGRGGGMPMWRALPKRMPPSLHPTRVVH